MPFFVLSGFYYLKLETAFHSKELSSIELNNENTQENIPFIHPITEKIEECRQLLTAAYPQ